MDDLLAPGTDFCLRLARANAVLVRRFDNALGSHHGISFSDFQLLNHLARAPGGKLRRVDLAERVGFAVVTAAGHELVVNATAVVDLVSREAVRGLLPDQVAAMAGVLGSIAGMNATNS